MKLYYPTVFCLGLFAAAISALGLRLPGSELLTCLLPSGDSAVATLSLGILLMVLSVVIYICPGALKVGAGCLGVILIALAIIGVLYPTYFGLLRDFIRPADLFAIFIAGLGYEIAALESVTFEPKSVLTISEAEPAGAEADRVAAGEDRPQRRKAYSPLFLGSKSLRPF